MERRNFLMDLLIAPFVAKAVNMEDERFYSSKPVDFPVDSANNIPIIGDIDPLTYACSGTLMPVDCHYADGYGTPKPPPG